MSTSNMNEMAYNNNNRDRRERAPKRRRMDDREDSRREDRRRDRYQPYSDTRRPKPAPRPRFHQVGYYTKDDVKNTWDAQKMSKHERDCQMIYLEITRQFLCGSETAELYNPVFYDVGAKITMGAYFRNRGFWTDFRQDHPGVPENQRIWLVSVNHPSDTRPRSRPSSRPDTPPVPVQKEQDRVRKNDLSPILEETEVIKEEDDDYPSDYSA